MGMTSIVTHLNCWERPFRLTEPLFGSGRIVVMMLVCIAGTQLRVLADNSAELREPAKVAEAQPGKTQAKAEAMMLRELQFQDASLAEAAEFFTIKSKEIDPAREGVKVLLQVPDNIKSKAAITLHLRLVPLSEGLRYCAELAGCVVKYEPNAIIIEEPAVMSTREWRFPPDVGKKIRNAMDWLEGQGVRLQAGSAASVVEDGATLVVRAPQEQLKLVDIVVEKLSAGPPSTLAAAEDKLAQPEDRKPVIIIPRVEFQDASLSETLEFFRIRARSLDPEKKGVNIILKDPEMAKDTRIALHLVNIPLWDALKYVAELTHRELISEKYGYLLRTPLGK